MKKIIIAFLILFFSINSLMAKYYCGPYIGRTAEYTFEELKADSGRTRIPETSILCRWGSNSYFQVLVPALSNYLTFSPVSVYQDNFDYYLTPANPNDLLSFSTYSGVYEIIPERFGDIEFNLQIIDKNTNTIYSGNIIAEGVKPEDVLSCEVSVSSELGNELYANGSIDIEVSNWEIPINNKWPQSLYAKYTIKDSTNKAVLTGSASGTFSPEWDKILHFDPITLSVPDTYEIEMYVVGSISPEFDVYIPKVWHTNAEFVVE